MVFDIKDIDTLENLGKQVYKYLYPSKLKRMLDKIESNKITLGLDKTLLNLPWELAHNGNEFLSSKFCIERRILPLKKLFRRRSEN